MAEKRLYWHLVTMYKIFKLSKKIPDRVDLVFTIILFYVLYDKGSVGNLNLDDDEIYILDQYVEKTDTSIKVDIDGLMNELGGGPPSYSPTGERKKTNR